MVIWSKSISNWTLTSYCFVTILIIIMVTFGASNDFDLVASATPALGGFFFDNVDYNFHSLIIFFIGRALDISYSATPALGGFLDAIASPCNWCCGWASGPVSQSVIISDLQSISDCWQYYSTVSCPGSSCSSGLQF